MLQQSPTFSPFMRKLAALAGIAGWAGNHQIIRVARPATRDRYDMIKMVILAYLLAAVIATTFLAFVLSLDGLLVNFTGGAATMVSFALFVWMGAVVAALNLSIALRICATPAAFNFPVALRVSGVTTTVAVGTGLPVAFGVSGNPLLYSFFRLFFVCRAIFTISFRDLFFMLCSIFAPLLLYPVRVLGAVFTVFSRDPFGAFAFPLSHCCIATRFTSAFQSVAFMAVFIEMLRRCREIIAASRAALERPGDVQHIAPRHAISQMSGVRWYECHPFGLQSLDAISNYTTKRGVSWLSQEAN